MKSSGLGWELGLWLVKVRVRLAIVCNSTPETTRVPCLIHWIGICICMRLAFNCCFWSCNKCGWHRHQRTSRTLSVGQGAPQLTFYAFSRFLWCWLKVNTEHNQSVMYVSVKFTETCKNVLIRISYVRRHLISLYTCWQLGIEVDHIMCDTRECVCMWTLGHYSWRNAQQGSWFIRALSDELLKSLSSPVSVDLTQVLTKVTRAVAYDFQSRAAVSRMGFQPRAAAVSLIQVPSLYSTLTKEIVFPPSTEAITNVDV